MKCSVQETVQPTDIVLNFGAWLESTDPTCGEQAGDDLCPHIHWLCGFLKAENPFRTWWLTTTPRVDNTTVIHPISQSHHLHIPTRCQLQPVQVLDRQVVIDILQPDPLRQHELWWDAVHLHADANHGFNRQFLSRMPEAAPKPTNQLRQKSVWKHMFPGGW
jgi:hypothetical protein